MVYEMTAVMRATLSPLRHGPVTFATLHGESRRMAVKSCRAMVDTLIGLGSIEETDGERPRLRLTPIGLYDILGDGAKSALLAFADADTVQSNLVPGSGRHPTSFRALGALAQGKPAGVYVITEAGRVVLAAALGELTRVEPASGVASSSPASSSPASKPADGVAP